MKIKNCAVIVADFPDDAVENEDGEFLIWPGRNIAEALCEILRGLGYQVEAPEHEHEHGWTFWSKAPDGRSTWFQVTDIEEYLLITEDFGGRESPFGPDKSSIASYTDLLTRLGAALHADERFKSVRWSTLDDVRLSTRGSWLELMEEGPAKTGDPSVAQSIERNAASAEQSSANGSRGSDGSEKMDGAIKTCAMLVVDVPHGGVFPRSAKVAQALCQILSDLGYETTQPFHQKDRGCTFTATARGGYRVGFRMVVLDEDYLLTTQNWGRRAGILDVFPGRKRAADAAAYADLLAKFAAALDRYPRFKSVGWRTEEEIGL